MLWLASVLVLLLAFANQHGSTCAVAAANEIVREGRFRMLAGFVLAAALSAVVIALFDIAPRRASALGWSSVAGGVVVALGVALNGKCAMGTLASLGRGRLDRIGTVAGFALGAVLAASAGLRPAAGAGQGLAMSGWALGLGALVVAFAAWLAARDAKSFSPLWLAAIGLLNAALLGLMADWSYTGGLTELAMGNPVDLEAAALFLACLVVGSAIAARLAGTLRIRAMGLGDWLRSGLGGAVMGAGSMLVPGGNDAMLLIGVPLLLPGLLLAYVSFWMALLAVRWLMLRRQSATLRNA